MDPAHRPINVVSIATATEAMLGERFDGFALVGFVAGCDYPMTIINPINPLKRMALQTMLQEAALDLATAASGS